MVCSKCITEDKVIACSCGNHICKSCLYGSPAHLRHLLDKLFFVSKELVELIQSTCPDASYWTETLAPRYDQIAELLEE